MIGNLRLSTFWVGMHLGRNMHMHCVPGDGYGYQPGMGSLLGFWFNGLRSCSQLLVARPLPPLARPLLLVVVETLCKSPPCTSLGKLAPCPSPRQPHSLPLRIRPYLTRLCCQLYSGSFGFSILASNTQVLLSDFWCISICIYRSVMWCVFWFGVSWY
jgi:hypothetical protein